MAGLPSINLKALLVGTMLAPPNTCTAAAVAVPGTGYVAADTIHLPDGVVLTVSTVTAGGVATVAITTPGSTEQIPTNPIPQVSSSGTGTGAEFNLTWTAQTTGAAFGTAVPDVPIPIGRQSLADTKFGIGSELCRMFQSFFANNFGNEVWALPLAEPAGASAATGSITITAPPTQAGTIHLYIAGSHVPVNVMTTDSIDDIANAVADAIMIYYEEGNPALPVVATTGTTGSGVVHLTCTFKGVNGNEVMVTTNYYGTLGSEITPPGLGITLPPTGFLTGGVGVPEQAQAISNIQKMDFEYVALPYTDSDSLFQWDQEYGFTDQGRWGWMREQFGHVFSAKRGLYGDLILFGDINNSGVEFDHGVRANLPDADVRMRRGLLRQSAARFDQRSGAAAADLVVESLQACTTAGSLRLGRAELDREPWLGNPGCWRGSAAENLA